LLRCLGANSLCNDHIWRRSKLCKSIHEQCMFSRGPLSCTSVGCFLVTVMAGFGCMLVPRMLTQWSLGWKLLLTIGALQPLDIQWQVWSGPGTGSTLFSQHMCLGKVNADRSFCQKSLLTLKHRDTLPVCFAPRCLVKEVNILYDTLHTGHRKGWRSLG